MNFRSYLMAIARYAPHFTGAHVCFAPLAAEHSDGQRVRKGQGEDPIKALRRQKTPRLTLVGKPTAP